jgi:GAF domain-containing protein
MVNGIRRYSVAAAWRKYGAARLRPQKTVVYSGHADLWLAVVTSSTYSVTILTSDGPDQMSYIPRDDRPVDKAEAYLEVESEILAVLEGETDRVARMATVAAMLADAFDDYFWTGFYVVDPARDRELVVGPYQGTLGCLRIAFGRGVCGTAAESRQTQIVQDVHAFPGHIACDGRSESEIVVPVFDAGGALIAVFDVDATTRAAFDTVDAQALERLMARVFGADA